MFTQRGAARRTPNVMGPIGGKPFNSSPSLDQMPDDFAALNLDVGPLHNKVLLDLRVIY